MNRVLLFVSAAALAACASNPPPANETTPQSASVTPAKPGASKACPLGIAGARVTVADSATGADLTFAAASENVTELRMRVERSAEVSGPGAHAGLGHAGEHGSGGDHGLKLATLPPLTTRFDKTDDGAILHLSAKEPAQVAELRSKIRERVAEITTAECK